MGRRKKLPKCECAACVRFNAEGVETYITLEQIELREPTPDPKYLRTLKRHLMPDGPCDLCGQDWSRRIPFVPQIIKNFLGVEGVCYACRSRLRDIQREHDWFICWGVTPDEEIKWLLLWLQLENFNKAVRALSPAQVERDRAFKGWLDSLPVEEAEPVELKIRVRRRVEVSA